MNIKSFLVSSLVVMALVIPTSVSAETPSFPSCSNPSGSLKVSYDSGNHAIVGESTLRTGSDKVYSLDSYNKLLQCFCAVDGSGVQTNWWKVSDLSEEEIASYLNQGWHYVPNGADWGLDQDAYLAYNLTYQCSTSDKPRDFQYGGPPVCTTERPSAPVILSVKETGSKAVVTWTKSDKATHYTLSYGIKGTGQYPYGVPNTGNQTSYTVESLDPNKNYDFKVYAVNDCMPSEATTIGGYVLGLASTGTAQVAYGLLACGVVLTLLGSRLRKAYN